VDGTGLYRGSLLPPRAASSTAGQLYKYAAARNWGHRPVAGLPANDRVAVEPLRLRAPMPLAKTVPSRARTAPIGAPDLLV
jgi:hypothetical protein